MKAHPDINDTLLEEGLGAVRARHDEAKRYGFHGKPPNESEARLIQSSRDFVANFVPPDYLVDGILQRRFIYSLTAPTGAGKTAVALLLSAHVGLDRLIGERRVEPGRVLYFAGENPDDIRMRWIAMADNMGFSLDEIDVHFIPGTFSIPRLMERIRKEADSLGGFDLVNIDTSAAYFDGDSENDNVQMGKHGRMLRHLTTLPRGPCVLVACHPTKNAGNDNLLPRGGGAFIAEMDGNLVCIKRGSIVDLHWQGKFRGPDFEPIGFELRTVTSPTLKDSEGRLIPTVMAKPLSESGREDINAAARKDEDRVLMVLNECPGKSIRGMAEVLEWFCGGSKQSPHTSRVHRALEKLKKGKFARIERDRWELTEKGKGEAKRVQLNKDQAGARH